MSHPAGQNVATRAGHQAGIHVDPYPCKWCHFAIITNTGSWLHHNHPFWTYVYEAPLCPQCATLLQNPYFHGSPTLIEELCRRKESVALWQAQIWEGDRLAALNGPHFCNICFCPQAGPGSSGELADFGLTLCDDHLQQVRKLLAQPEYASVGCAFARAQHDYLNLHATSLQRAGQSQLERKGIESILGRARQEMRIQQHIQQAAKQSTSPSLLRETHGCTALAVPQCVESVAHYGGRRTVVHSSLRVGLGSMPFCQPPRGHPTQQAQFEARNSAAEPQSEPRLDGPYSGPIETGRPSVEPVLRRCVLCSFYIRTDISEHRHWPNKPEYNIFWQHVHAHPLCPQCATLLSMPNVANIDERISKLKTRRHKVTRFLNSLKTQESTSEAIYYPRQAEKVCEVCLGTYPDRGCAKLFFGFEYGLIVCGNHFGDFMLFLGEDSKRASQAFSHVRNEWKKLHKVVDRPPPTADELSTIFRLVHPVQCRHGFA